MEHTPGPWESVDGGIVGGLYVGRILSPPGSHGTQMVIAREVFSAANARLIAAAPELLEALERIANHQSRSDRRHQGMVDVSELDGLQRIAEKAVREATEIK